MDGLLRFGCCLLLLVVLSDPVVQALAVSRDLDGVELHSRNYTEVSTPSRFDIPAHTKDSLILPILRLGVHSQHSTEVIIIDLLLIRHHELAPSLFAGFALHLVLVDGLGDVELGEVGLEMLVDLIVNFCQAQLRALDFLEDGPVGGHVLDDWMAGLVAG